MGIDIVDVLWPQTRRAQRTQDSLALAGPSGAVRWLASLLAP